MRLDNGFLKLMKKGARTMINIEEEELKGSLQKSYKTYNAFLKNNDKEKLAFVKGFCNALEKIAIAYGGFTNEQIQDIKFLIIGNVSMTVETKNDLDTPTYIRKNVTIIKETRKENV